MRAGGERGVAAGFRFPKNSVTTSAFSRRHPGPPMTKCRPCPPDAAAVPRPRGGEPATAALVAETAFPA